MPCDELLNALECREVHAVEIRIHQVRDYVYRQRRVDGPVHERELCGHVGGANRNSYLVAADAVAIYQCPKNLGAVEKFQQQDLDVVETKSLHVNFFNVETRTLSQTS